MSRNNFVLLGTIHDVRGKNKELFSENIEALKEIYDSIYVTISDATAKEFVEILEKSGINYKIIAKKGAADSRRNVLKFGLTDTELVTNHMFEFYYGSEADITAGSCILSRKAAEIVSELSNASMTDGEWPSFLLKRNYKVDHIYVDGLKYIDEFNGITNPQKQSKELMDRLNLCRKICESIYDAYNN